MATNRNFGKLNEGGVITYAPSVIRIGDSVKCTPSAADYAAAGYLPIISEPPTAVGVNYTPTNRGEVVDGAIHRVYEAVPIVAPVRCYKVEDIIYGLIQRNALQAVKQIVGDLWELFTMRDVISADNEIWAARIDELKAAIVASGALTANEFDAVLKDAEV